MSAYNPNVTIHRCLPQLQTQASKQKFTMQTHTSTQAVPHFSCPILTNLQGNNANSSKGHNATSNAMMEFFLKIIPFTHWSAYTQTCHIHPQRGLNENLLYEEY